MHGKGVLLLSNGDMYEGTFKQGQFCGTGRFTYADGGYYEVLYVIPSRYIYLHCDGVDAQCCEFISDSSMPS